MTRAVLLVAVLAPIPVLAGDEAPDPEDAPAATDPDVPEPPAPKSKWGGVVVPLVGASTVDGFGFGLGGEVFRRPPGQTVGFDLKVTASLYVNTRFDYTNDFVRVQVVDHRRWLLIVGYQQWANLSYVGAGGADVVRDLGSDEIGNGLISPYGVFGVAQPIGDGPWAVFGQLYGRGGIAEPAPERLLERDAPFGVDGGVYGDVTVGVQAQVRDRWPLPTHGHQLEAGVRVGGTASKAPFEPAAGLVVEGMAWRPLGTRWFTGSTRVLVAKSVGVRPFFERDKVGNRWRDELGNEQALGGYGRTRTRGDGAVPALVELRPRLFVVEEGFFDVEVYLSVHAEAGFLFDGWDPGPFMPTIGVNGSLLWQKTVQLRPFAAWGWREPEPGAPRRPSMQCGISVMDAL